MNEFKKLPSRARFNMFLSGLIWNLIFSGGIVIALLIIKNVDFFPYTVKNVAILLSKIAFAYLILDTLLEPTLGYSRYRYRVTEDSVEKISGIFTKSHEIVPIHRMQQIELEESFFNRLFKLSSLLVITSGGEMTVEYLSIEEGRVISERLKSYINGFAQEESLNGKS